MPETENEIDDNKKTATQLNGTNKEKEMSKEEYFKALEKWLHQTRMLQSMNSCFPYYLMANYPQLFNSNNNSIVPPNETRLTNGIRPNNNNAEFERGSDFEIISRLGGVEYIIPPIWKRLVAELIDFLILFFIKLALIYVIVDMFDLIDFDNFDMLNIRDKLKPDYSNVLTVTSDLIILECLNRITVCVFEAIWLQRGIGGTVGGATPGKSVMGLRVIYATAFVPVPGRDVETVLVHPADNLGVAVSLARSIVKNLLLAMLFPMFFVIFFFSYNRTCYDMLCRSLVVEENRNPIRRRP